MPPRPREVSLTTTLRVSVRMDQSAVALERAIAEEGRRAGRELYLEVARTLDACSVRSSGGVRQRVDVRWIATLIGRFRLPRYRVKADRKTFHPVDRRLRLGRSEASPGVLASVRELAAHGLTYQQLAVVLTHLTGTPFSRQTVWRMLRRAEGDVR
jgi:hypothetical protein